MKRARNKRRLLWLDIGVIFATVVLVAVGIWYGYLRNINQLSCKAVGSVHEITLNDDVFSPKSLTLKRCDVIKIVNTGSQQYHLAFGLHDKHVPYPGFTEQLVGPNEFIEIDAVQAGAFVMHDHLRDKAHLELTIER